VSPIHIAYMDYILEREWPRCRWC